MLVCFSDNNNHSLCGQVDFLHCVCCDIVAITDPFCLKGSRKLGSHHQISTHVISVGCWLSSIFFIVTRQYFQRKRQLHCFVMISGMILQIWKEERIRRPSFVLRDLRGLWSGSLRGVYLAIWSRVFPVPAPETSASSRRKYSLGIPLEMMAGASSDEVDSQEQATLPRQLAGYIRKSLNLLLLSSRGKISPTSQKPLELLLFTTRRVPQVSVYTTHIKNNWLTYQYYEIPVFEILWSATPFYS